MSRALRFIAPLFMAMLLFQFFPSCSLAAPADNDLYIVSVESIQVVENPRGIIINKSTALRVEVMSSFSSITYAEFEITYDFGRRSCVDRGPDGYGVPLVNGVNEVYLPGGNCTAHFSGWWTNPLTLIWSSVGTDTGVTVEVDPSDLIEEGNELNNVKTCDVPINVVYSRPLRILVIPVRDSSGTYEYDLDDNIRMLRDQYPLADDGIVVVEAPWESRDYSTRSEAKDVARSFSADARALGYDRVIVVFKELIDQYGELYGSAVGMVRDPEDRVPFLATASGLDLKDDLLAHELGHTYYLWHPHDIGIELYETNIWRCFYRQYESRASTTMSYDWILPAGVPAHVRWMDEQRYQSYPKTWIDLPDEDYPTVDGVWEWSLYDQFVTNPPIRIPSVLISGMIFLNGTVILNQTMYRLAEGVLDLPRAQGPMPPGNYSVRLLDISEKQIGNFDFDVSFTEMTQWDERTEATKEELTSVSFDFNIPDIPNTRYVQIVNATDAVLAQRVVSDNAPSVQITAPMAGEEVSTAGLCDISWVGEDIDRDQLTYLLAFSPDGGSSWIPISDGVTGSTYTWDTTGVRPGDDYRIKIIASDGYNSAEDVSDAFSIYDDSPPTTTIGLEGTEGQNGWFVSDVNVTLTATDNYRVRGSECSFDGTTWSNYTGKFSVTGEGNTTLHYRSLDEEGNVEDDRIAYVLIDRTKPTVQITSITNGTAITAENLTAVWSSSDAISGIADHRIRLDNGSWSDVGLKTQWNLTDLTQGVHTMEVLAIDNAGNTNASVVWFQVDGKGIDIPPGGDGLLIATVIAMVVIIAVGLYALYRKKT